MAISVNSNMSLAGKYDFIELQLLSKQEKVIA